MQSDPADPAFLALETDAAAIAAFVTDQNRRTQDALCDARFDEDVETATRLLEDPNRLNALVRRGSWLFTFRQSQANPRGVWMRLAEGQDPAPGAAWETVFDLDRFCAETGETWHWRGATTAWFNPMRVMLRLSLGGSDRCRHIEFDCDAKAPVAGGFDLPPDRSSVDWLDPDTLLWSTAEGQAATASGWAGEVRRLTRGTPRSTAPVIFRAAKDDLLVQPYVVPRADGTPMVCISRYLEIGQEAVSILDNGAAHSLPAPRDTLVWHNETHFAYVVQKDGGTPGALMLGACAGGAIRTVFKPGARHHVAVYSVLFLRDWLLWIEVKDLRRSLRALPLNEPDAMPVTLSLPEEAETFWVGYHDAGGLAGDGTLALHLTGFLTPPTSFTFDLARGPDRITWHPLRREPHSFDASTHRVSLLDAVSADGTRVPYHLVHPKDRAPDGDLPVLLYGYGGFANAVDPRYDRLTGALWLTRGGAYALAHIRGGSEFGPAWHRAAQGPGRERAFEDFAAVAADLASRKISRPGRIACHGHSNGGLLCGVMLTRYPERFGAVWASVGVFDMARFHRFPAGRAWIDEYGDPDDATALAWLVGYSPLHQVRARGDIAYPPALIDTSTGDDRVDPSHARRFVAVLEAHGHRPWFYEHGDAGHGGGGATRSQAREQALGHSFLRHALSLDP